MNNKSETSQIAELLDEVFSGDPWHGASVLESIEHLNVTQADNKAGRGHTAGEILFHMTSWRKFVIRRLNNLPENKKIDRTNWPGPEIESRKPLYDVIHELKETHKELLELIRECPDQKLAEAVPGKKYNFRKLLYGIIHHDLYHLGQINLLLKM